MASRSASSRLPFTTMPSSRNRASSEERNDGMLRPATDSARKSMLETFVHALVACLVVIGATVLCAMGKLDAQAWAVASGIAITASGAVGIVQGKSGNGHIVDEASALSMIPGGRRATDPPVTANNDRMIGHLVNETPVAQQEAKGNE